MKHLPRLRRLEGGAHGCGLAAVQAQEVAHRAAFAWIKTRTWPEGVSPGWRYHRCVEIEEALGCGYSIASDDFAGFRAAHHPQRYLGDEPARFVGDPEAEVFRAAHAEAEAAIRDACAAGEEWPRWL